MKLPQPKTRVMASQRPEPETSGMAVAARFMMGTLVGFALTGVLFFMLLAIWSILAGPFVRLQSASFVIVLALAIAVAAAVWLYRHFNKTMRQHRKQ